jgi:serine protease Do
VHKSQYRVAGIPNLEGDDRTTDRSFRILCVLFLLSLLTLIPTSPSHAVAKEEKVVTVVDTASRAIVNIKTEEWAKNTGDTKKGNPLNKLFASGEEEEEIFENIGSGVVLDPRGIIVTNEHLISKATSIRVRFMNGKEYEAYVLGSDPEFDMALLKVTEKHALPYLKVSNRAGARVGEKAVVIGNPYGLSSSVTVGVISAVGRNLKIDNRSYVNLIQTDAAINPGNSGGALLDTEGNLLGIVTAIYGEGKGIGFAIPIEDVTNMLSEFLEIGVRRPLLGLFVEKRRDERGSYLYATRILQGSPAERLGIRVGDRIIELNKKKAKDGVKLHSILRSVKPQSGVQVKFYRGPKMYSLNFDLEELEAYKPSPVDEGLCGMRVGDIKGYQKLKFKLKEKEGAVVIKVYPGGLGEKCGLRAGDVILKINNNPVSNRKDFDSYMVEGLKRNYILFQVKRSDNVFFLPVKLDTLL